MGDYVLKDSEGVFESKFLNRPRRYFVGYPLTLDFILSEAAYQQWLAFGSVKNFSINGIPADTIEIAGQGLYRYPLTISENSDVRVQIQPSNLFGFWDFGTFETSTNPSGILEVDTASYNMARTNTDAYQGSWSIALRSDASSIYDMDNENVIAFKAGSVTAGSKYEMKMWVKFVNSFGGVVQVGVDSGNFYLSPLGVPSSNIENFSTVDAVQAFNNPQWQELSVIFTATTTGLQTVYLYANTLVQLQPTGVNDEIIWIDNVYFSGPIINLSEEIPLVYDSACTNYEYYVKWLNPLGGYDYWLFKGAKAVGYETEATEIKRNIYGNWDSSFINADTERDYITGGAKKITTLRSTNITKDEADYVSGMAKSTKVYKYENGEWITILVQKGSLSLYSEKDKTASISIDVIETFDELSQNQ